MLLSLPNTAFEQLSLYFSKIFHQLTLISLINLILHLILYLITYLITPLLSDYI